MKIVARARMLFVLALIGCVHFQGIARALDAAQTREAFLKMIDRPRVDPRVEVKDPDEADGVKITKFSYDSEANERVPGIAVYPSDTTTKLPCIIVMHGTGGTKEGQMGLLKKLALQGCIAVAIDGRYHGERAKPQPGLEKYNQAIVTRFMGETKSYPFYWDTCYDVMRLLDILSAREDIDFSRIGLIGFSKGGIETYFIAAVDPRITVAVPCIGVQSFKWGLENNAWHNRVNTVRSAFEASAKASGVDKPDAAFAKKFFDKVVPGIDGDFDGPQMLPLIAPRPLLMINGDSDGNTPLPGVMICAEKAKAAYEKAGAADKFKQIVEPKTGHKVNDDAMVEAIEFFKKHLGL